MKKDAAVVLGIIAMFNIEKGYMEITGTICAPGLTIYSAAYLTELSRRFMEQGSRSARLF